jgi:hypothetical protein
MKSAKKSRANGAIERKLTSIPEAKMGIPAYIWSNE